MANHNSSFIDFRALFTSYVRHWYLFVISIICCLAVGFVATRIFKEKYGIRANILIQEEEKSPLSSLGSLGDLIGSESNVDDEIFVISSHSLYRDVVKDLGLNVRHMVRVGFLDNELTWPDYPIDVKFNPEIADTLRTPLLFRIKVNEEGLANIKVLGKRKKKLDEVKNVTLPHTFVTPYGEFTVERTKYYPIGEEVNTKITVQGYHAEAEDLAKEIDSDIPSKRSNVIAIALNSTNPVLGTAIIDTLIELYNQRGINEKNLERRKTAAFIEKRVEELRNELASAESEIQRYKEEHSLVDVEAEVLYQNTKKGLIEEQLIVAQTQLEVIKLAKDFLENPNNKYELVPNVIDNAVLGEAIAAYNASLLERNNMLRTVSPNNIAVEKLTAAIDESRKGIVTSINQALKNAIVTVNDLKVQLASADTQLSLVPDYERNYIQMNRQRIVKNEIYLFLLSRREENDMMLANAIPKGVVVDEAYVLDKTIGLPPIAILLIFFAIGLILPPIYLYIVKLIRNRFETREEVERRITAPILGEMCTDSSGRSLVVSENDTSSATELFRLMRANLLFVLNDKTDKVVLLTSTTSGEGKSFISINLAASMALLGKKVLLVGMDIRAPKLSSYLGVNSQFGLTQYLANDNISLDSIIVRHPEPGIPTLDIIIAGPIPPNPAELLTSNRVDDMFAKLRTMYDYIIVDTAPVGMVSDTFTLDRIADATIYVTRTNYSLNSHLDFIEEIYQDSRLKKLSVVINGVRSKKTYGYRTQKGAIDH